MVPPAGAVRAWPLLQWFRVAVVCKATVQSAVCSYLVCSLVAAETKHKCMCNCTTFGSALMFLQTHASTRPHSAWVPLLQWIRCAAHPFGGSWSRRLRLNVPFLM